MMMVRVEDSRGPITRAGVNSLEEGVMLWGTLDSFLLSGREEYVVTFEGADLAIGFCRVAEQVARTVIQPSIGRAITAVYALD